MDKKNNFDFKPEESIIVGLKIIDFEKKSEESMVLLKAWETEQTPHNQFLDPKHFFYGDIDQPEKIDFIKIHTEIKIKLSNDTLIISLPYKNDADLKIKSKLIICETSYLLGFLATANLFVKGGVSFGLISFENNQYNGNGYTDVLNLINANDSIGVILSEKFSNLNKNNDYIKQIPDKYFELDWLLFLNLIEHFFTKTINHVNEFVEKNISDYSGNLELKENFEKLKRQIEETRKR